MKGKGLRCYRRTAPPHHDQIVALAVLPQHCHILLLSHTSRAELPLFRALLNVRTANAQPVACGLPLPKPPLKRWTPSAAAAGGKNPLALPLLWGERP